MTNLILKSSKSLISICRSKKYVILFSVAEMSSGRNVRGRNVRGRNVLAETSVAEMSVAEMSEHRGDTACSPSTSPRPKGGCLSTLLNCGPDCTAAKNYTRKRLSTIKGLDTPRALSQFAVHNHLIMYP